MKYIIAAVAAFLVLTTSVVFAQTPTQTATFSLTWTDTNSGARQEDGTRVERSNLTTGPWTNVGSVGPDVVKYADAILNDIGGVQQCYRVIAFNKAGSSAPSNTACATSPTIQIAPGAPGQVNVNVSVTVNVSTP